MNTIVINNNINSLPPQSSSNPALLDQAHNRFYAYNAAHTRTTRFGNLADSESDIDAIFGVFDANTTKKGEYMYSIFALHI